MRRLGYIRESPENVEQKKKLLRQEGCSLIFKDIAVSSKEPLTGFSTLLEELSSGDEVVIEDFDQLAPSLNQLIQHVQAIRQKGAHIELVKKKFHTNKTYSSDEWFGLLEVTHSTMVEKRTKQAREGAKARGRQGGRPEEVSKQDKDEIKRLYHLNLPVRTICERLDISRPTLYKYLKQF